MGLLGLLLILFGVVGTFVQFLRIVIYAFREQGPLWGALCLLVPPAILVWGILHWDDEDSRTLFIRYLLSGLFLIVGLFLHARFNRLA